MEVFNQFKGQNEVEFLKTFSTKENCFSYLAHHKWHNGFICPHCNCSEEANCNQMHAKRCKSCQRVISATSNTLFHKMKFGIEKAFYIVFKMSATTKSISAEQLSKTVGVNRKTALLFQQKVRLAMKSSGKYPLKGQVEVDEAFIGQQEAGAIGRGAQEKAQIAIAVEKNGVTGIKRVYIHKIDNASSSQLKVLFEAHISPLATVLTDKWKGYTPLTEAFNITQEKSQPDKNFKVMHRCIQQVKSWIRGVHHSVHHDYLQGYLNEFCYRINRSQSKETIFDNLLVRMVNGLYKSKKQIKFVYNT
jgi:transposase-like protein